MKSSVKKTLALVISLTMIATTFPMTALAAGQGSDKITKGENSGTIVNQEDPFDFTTEKGARKVLKKEEGLPDAFDQRNVGGKSYVTPVKLQNPFGSCWGFAAIGAAETSILGAGLKGKDEEGNEITYVDRSRKGDDKYTKAMDLSEKHLAYFAAMPLDMPGFAQDGEGTHHSSSVTSSDIMSFGGNLVLATNTFATGMGPNLEEIYSYDNEGDKVPDNSLAYRGKEGIIDQRYFKSKLYTKAGYHPFCYSAEDDWSLDKDDRFLQSFILKQSYILPNPAGSASSGGYEYNPAGTAAIKEQLYAKRGVEIGFCADTSSPNQEAGEDGVYISTKNWAHYTWRKAGANHAVQIVGWDDNYPKENFVEGHQPPEDGAWLVKNSWGSEEEEFPNHAEGSWGLLNGQDKGVLDQQSGKYKYEAEPDAKHTGYFWISYYDQSLAVPEALEFDRTNEDDGYYLDQHDFMQVHSIEAKKISKEAKMANVFKADVCQTLEQVSCMTTYPETEVTFEIYLLQKNYTDPEDGIKIATVRGNDGSAYKYGGFHKENVPEKPVIQKGQNYSIVVTQKTPGNYYAINTPRGGARKVVKWDVGIINKGESYIKIVDAEGEEAEWKDYSDKNVRSKVLNNLSITEQAFDNFPIKGFCKKTDRDISMRLKGDASNLMIFRDSKYNFRLSLTGVDSFDGEAEIEWKLYEGRKGSNTSFEKVDDPDEYAKIEEVPGSGGTKVVVTPQKSGSEYLTVTLKEKQQAEGGTVKENVIGTVVAPITTYRPSPGKILFKDDELGDTVTKVYTGEEIRPDVTVHLDDVLNTQLNEDEYTLTYADNIKCGAGTVKATGVYPLDDSDENSISKAFLIVPEKGNIEKITAGEESITIDVQDQKDSGISGYGVQYREEGVSDWQYEKFGADSASLVIKGLTAGKSYEVRACAYIDILNANGEEELNGLYSGELSEPVISAEVKKAEKKTEETENKPDNKNEKKTEKKANTLTVKGKTVKVKYKKLKNKSQKISRAKAINVKNAEGKVTYKLVSVKKLKASKAKKKAAKSKKARSTKKQPAFKVSSKGKIIVRKGLGKGTYKLKIKVTAAGNSGYEKGAKNAAVTIKIK